MRRWWLLVAVILSGCGPSGLPDSTRRVSTADTRPVVFDFARRLSRGVFTPARHAVRFTEADGDALIEGWSFPEVVPETGRHFTWAIGRSSTVSLQLQDTTYSTLDIRCAPFVGPTDQTQTVVIGANGVELGTLTLAPTPTTYTLTVPEGTLVTGQNLIRFDFSYATAPSSLGDGDDTRPLAAAFELVALGWGTEPIDDASAPPVSLTSAGDGSNFRQQANSELAFTLTVPEGGALEYGLRATGADEGVRGDVALKHADGSEEVVLSVPAEPGSTDRWQTDLSDYVGTKLDVVFRATAMGPATGGVTWVAPRLHSSLAGLDTTTNVVLIVIDTLRADYVSAYGGQVDTPAIDRLAARGVRFANAYSHIPITMASHSSMFTSLIPIEHGVLNNDNVLAKEHVTLAELLQSAYRSTAAFVSLGVLRPWQGIAQGFDRFDASFDTEWWKPADVMDGLIRGWVNEQEDTPFFLWAHYSDPHEPYTPPVETYPSIELRQGGRRVASLPLDWTATRVELQLPPGRTEVTVGIDRSIRSNAAQLTITNDLDAGVTVDCGTGCRARTDGDWFTLQRPGSVIFTNPGSQPVTIETMLRAREALLPIRVVRRRYGEEAEYADRYIGELLDALEARGWLDDTLVILTSDHGEGLGDHERVDHVSELYNSNVHVPLIVSWPGTLPEGLVIDEPVAHIDLLPTIAELLHLPDPKATDREGTSLVGLMTGRDTTLHRDRPILSQTFAPEAQADLEAIVLDGYKLIRAPDDGSVQLYDLSNDPGERHDLSTEDPERAATLSAALDQALERAAPRAKPRRQRMRPEDLERLRSLGYVR